MKSFSLAGISGINRDCIFLSYSIFFMYCFFVRNLADDWLFFKKTQLNIRKRFALSLL